MVVFMQKKKRIGPRKKNSVSEYQHPYTTNKPNSTAQCVYSIHEKLLIRELVIKFSFICEFSVSLVTSLVAGQLPFSP